ncbi:MAG TPA: hypothetical protein VF980_13815 [Thermoanaerobaculia bacterium]
MATPRLGFLPVFFSVLGIAFAIAVVVRVRSYSNEATPVRGIVVATAPDATSAPVVSVGSRTTSGTGEQQGDQPAERARKRAATSTADWKIIPVTGPAPTSKTTTRTETAPPAPPPSLLSRIVAPIVNAVRGGPPKPAAQPAPAQTPPSMQSSGGGRPSTDTGAQTSTQPKDPNSDTQPPQIVSISFSPAQVQDGQETVLTIQATDDLSGIRSISGTIASPSGAVQGFALQRDQQIADLYTSRVPVPKDAAEGVWRINYLSLVDNASNANTFNGGNLLPPTASFRVVSSSSDTTGPVLKAVWLDRLAIKAGDKDTVFVQAEDDKSGVNLVSGVLISPRKLARVGFVCRQSADMWECDVSTPACIDCGDWQLEQIQMQDKANNMTTVRSENPLVANVRLNITGESCDSTAPTISTLALDRTVVSNADDTAINVTVSASDDTCGVMSMSGQVSGPITPSGAPRLYFSLSGVDAQTWVGRIVVPKHAAKGPWRISWIQVLDKAQNLKTYTQSDPPVTNGVFNVQ